MKTYRIKEKFKDDYRYCVYIQRKGDKNPSSIYLSRNAATDKLKIDDKITVLRDSCLGIEDMVYLYRGGMSFAQSVASNDEFGCKLYVKNIRGLFSDLKLDRIAFKIALMKECERRGKTPSLVAWRNLQNLTLYPSISR